MRWIILTLLLAACNADAFEVGEIKSGYARARVRELLPGWNFDRIADSDDSLLAYDLPEKQSNRLMRFLFCNDRLVGLDQAMSPSIRNFIVITNNYLTLYGQPARVDAGVNVIASGEKNVLALHWRRGPETIGVRYLQLGGGEELRIIYDVPNSCWNTPRAP